MQDQGTGKRVRKQFEIVDDMGQQLFEGLSRDDSFDTNDHVEIVVDKEQKLSVRVEGQEPVVVQAMTQQQLVTIDVADAEDTKR